MKKRPVSIAVISWIFIVVGIITFVTGLLPLIDQGISEFMAECSVEFVVSQIVRTLAVVSGVGMLFGFNWARWLLVGWLGYHVILSIFHPLFELLVHGLLFVVMLYFLFRTQVSAYFKGTATPPPISK